MSFDGPTMVERVMFLIPMLLSLTVHEWAHARAAYALGDDTASLMGRMSLNPMVHIDIIGTIMLPLLGVPFGWAKPVPVNPMRFSRKYSMRWGMMITAAAGPLSNVVLAAASAAILSLLWHLAPSALSPRSGIALLLTMLVRVNVALAIFNLIPVPPLDGSRLADYFMPASLRPYWDSLYRSGPIGLVLLLVALQFFGGALSVIIGGVMRLVYAMVGL
jgi:Zn-dependent protease